MTSMHTQAADQTCNGWTNYETWVINLWMNNDQGSPEYWAERAEELINDENSVDTLAHEIQGNHEDASKERAVIGPFADLLGYSLGRVNWHEIAESLISEVDVVS